MSVYGRRGSESHALRNLAVRRRVTVMLRKGLDKGEDFRLFFCEAHRKVIERFQRFQRRQWFQRLFVLCSIYNTNKNRTQGCVVDNCHSVTVLLTVLFQCRHKQNQLFQAGFVSFRMGFLATCTWHRFLEPVDRYCRGNLLWKQGHSDVVALDRKSTPL